MANEIPEALEKDKKTVTKASAKKTTTKKTAAKKTAAKTTAKKATAKKAAKPSSKLVIVESPAKAKTIQKYLGKGYEVMASMGHVRDLPKSRLGVDIEHDFQPEYIDIRGKGELRNQLKKAAKHSSFVYLATDPDREGEAISWHLSNMLGLDNEEKNRVTFNEITKTGIKNRATSTSIWSTPSRPAAFSTGWSDISSARFCGKRSNPASPRAGCSRWSSS